MALCPACLEAFTLETLISNSRESNASIPCLACMWTSMLQISIKPRKALAFANKTPDKTPGRKHGTWKAKI
uniref:Uncharacterized protein n=1 Tax=Anguilla anguilla TaxID=7936 RepID=A0A0E9X8C7_ANGAN